MTDPRRKLYDVIPPRSRKTARRLYRAVERTVNRVIDAAETVTGRRDPLTPPRHMIDVGSNSFTKSDFRAIGEAVFRDLVEIGGLRPDDAVLDVGCGIGRMAVPLTTYLSTRGSYEGFDIALADIDWCSKHITPRFPNFRFRHSDIRNARYNPHGRLRAIAYSFPYPDAAFDFVLLTSVFTHMQTSEMKRYLAEISRVMKPEATAFITYFLLDEDSRRLVSEGRSAWNFSFELAGCWTVDPNEPEIAIAIDAVDLRARYQAVGLTIHDVRFGGWCQRPHTTGFQDVVVARKRARQTRSPR